MVRSLLFAFPSALALAFACTQVAAPQTPAHPNAADGPVPLAGVYYRYWPVQIVQWIGTELPYSMAILDVDNRTKQPIYDMELIPRDSSSGVHYTNSAEELALDRAAGMTVHQVTMQLDGPDEPAKGAQYMLRFSTETGKPVVWQFVEGTDVSEQGSGLTPVDAPIPILLYREQGALAGEGSAIQIGGVTSTAEVWQQYAQPPYFVPYHGALSTGVHVLSFVPGPATWTRGSGTLTSEHGSVLAVDQDAEGLKMTDKALGVTLQLSPANGALQQVVFGPVGAKRDGTISLLFTPALQQGASSDFTLVAGKKKRVASGTVQVGAAPNGGTTEAWSFSKPEEMVAKHSSATVVVKP